MDDFPSCPTPRPPVDRLLLAHGEGARLSRRLIRDVLLCAFDSEFLRTLPDAAVLPPIDGPAVLSTDSYVVSPLFFPGGDIGKLAVHGTVNDLAVCGAVPLYLSVGLILEEGLPVETLRRIVASIAEAAHSCGVSVVTGDTKVVPRGAADGLFVNTTGLGRLRPGVALGAHRVRPGDRILVSGTIGDHGIAVLCAREGIELESPVRSDSAPLHELVAGLLSCGADLHFLRDPTRGGLSAVLHEIAESAGCSVVLEERLLPVNEAVRGVCELLGLDPLYVANEGMLLAIVAAEDVDRSLMSMQGHPLGVSGAVVGEVVASQRPQILVRGPLGTLRVLDEPSGAPLPRIC